MHKIITIAIFLLLTKLTNGQIVMPLVDSSVIIGYKHDAVSISNKEPLVIINSKKIPFENLQLHFFNLSNIESIKVYKPKDDSAKLYGQAARNGVVIIQTTQPVNWQSATEIFRNYDKNPFHFYRKTLFVVDDISVEPGKEFYKKTIAITTSLKTNG